MNKLGWVVSALLLAALVAGAAVQGQGQSLEAQKLDDIKALLQDIRFVKSFELHAGPIFKGRGDEKTGCTIDFSCVRAHREKAEQASKK